MKRQQVSLLFFLLFLSVISNAQVDHLWLFGPNSPGIRFDNTTLLPTVISGKYTPYSSEGCSVICDPVNGQLLYYSNGIAAIDRNNLIMPNGSGLSGHSSSAQNGWSAPMPGQCDRYYIFSNSSAREAIPSGTLYYSIVDMSLPGNGTMAVPLGDIVSGSKNISLVSGTQEGVVLIESTVKNEYWILVSMYSSATIRVFKITSSGIAAHATFNYGTLVSDIRSLRYSRQAGKFSIVGAHGADPVVICDFNNTTGIISNPYSMPGVPYDNVMYQGRYDAEWSADGTKLYFSQYRFYSTSTAGRLYQYDLNNPATAAVLIYAAAGTVAEVGRGLKRGPDNKIYWLYGQVPFIRYIGVVNAPNAAGAACNFNPLGLDMGSNLGNAHKFPDFLIFNNQRPIAQDDINTAACIGSNDTIINVLQNDVEPDGDALTVSIQKTNHGTAVLLPDQRIQYTKNFSYSGNDTIWYKICDNDCHSLCDSAIVVICLNSCPAIKSSIFTKTPSDCVTPNGTATVTMPTDGNTYQFSWDGGSYSNSTTANNLSVGTHTLSTKLLPLNCVMDTSFTIVINTLSNNPPIAQDDIETSICIYASDTVINILNNDSEPDGENMTVSIQRTKYGTSVLLANNTIRYTKISNYVGRDTIWYKICDNNCYSKCDSAMVVICLNNCPVIRSSLFTKTPSNCGSASGSAAVTMPVDGNTYQFSWNGGPYTNSASGNNLAAGTNTLSIRTLTYCTKDTSFTIVPKSISNSNATTPDHCLAGIGSATITASEPSATILWTDGNTSFNRNNLASGSYHFTITDPISSCTSNGSVIISNVSEDIQAEINYATTFDSIGNKYTVSFDSISPLANYQSILWEFGDGSTGVGYNPIHDFAPGVYTVKLTVTSVNGCVKIFSAILTLKAPVQCTIAIPTAFSPNGDNMNDNIGVLGYASKIDLKIFNRWGEVIFRTTLFTEKWNGLYRDVEAPGGVYPYILNYECLDENGNVLQTTNVGEITLVR